MEPHYKPRQSSGSEGTAPSPDEGRHRLRRHPGTPSAMALPPLSWLLRFTALCHLIVLLAGECGGLRHERGGGAPSPTSAPQASMRAPRPRPRKAEIRGSPFLTDMPEGAGHLPGGGPRFRTAPPAGWKDLPSPETVPARPSEQGGDRVAARRGGVGSTRCRLWRGARRWGCGKPEDALGGPWGGSPGRLWAGLPAQG